MSVDKNKHIEDLIKQYIEEALGVNKKETKIDEEATKEFDTVLEFAVNRKKGQAGLLVNNDVLKSYNKKLYQVLLDNIEASLLLLRENLE
jgi:hypothetical protein